MLIFITNGDLFQSNAAVLVNPVNCVGVMGAGIAKQFKEKFPQMFKEYYKECKEQKLELGVLHIWTDTKTTIVNFPTKIAWSDRSDYNILLSGLNSLKSYFRTLAPGTTIALPALGCGLGGLAWATVKSILISHLGEFTNLKILIYEPN